MAVFLLVLVRLSGLSNDFYCVARAEQAHLSGRKINRIIPNCQGYAVTFTEQLYIVYSALFAALSKRALALEKAISRPCTQAHLSACYHGDIASGVAVMRSFAWTAQ